MNQFDKKLQEFFYDIKNMERYKGNYSGLGNFYIECTDILEQKKYSNINMQDEKGNTYMHYLSAEKSWNWFIKLSNIGGDPTILNNDGKNAFEYCRYPDGVFNFWRITSVKELGNFNLPGWQERTKEYAINYKQFYFDGYVKDNSYTFSTMASAFEFLDKSSLLNDKNKLAIVGVSDKIPMDEKISWLKEQNSTPEEITHFLENIITPSILGNIKEKNINGIIEVLNMELCQNAKFNKIAQKIISTNKKYGEVDNLCRCLIKSMISKNFDFNQKIENYGSAQTILTEIQKNPVVYAMFLDEQLTNNNSDKKKIKV